jgi:hypothetical protein
MTSLRLALPSALLAACLSACGGDPAPDASEGASAGTSAGAAVAHSPLLLEVEPPDAVPVLAALSGAEGDVVTVVGRIQAKVKGFAMFHIVDDSVKDCTRSGCDSCPTPWDYCCHEKEMLAAIMLVELRGADGQPQRVASLGVRELDLVVVKGTLAKGEGGRLMLLAQDGWYRRDRPKVSARVKFPS